ncbi:MAG: hypothetical protein K8R92_10825 [Planctomycetes bacterium]|nr:hypothetical protein [Planctomycetota bacterium]
MKSFFSLVVAFAALSTSAVAQTKPAAPATPAGVQPGKTPAPPAQKSSDTAAKSAKNDPAKPGVGETDTRRQVFILPLGGMVGVGLRHNEMEKIEKEADKYGPGQIIIIRINSGGGLVTEGDEIAETLTRMRDKHRVVAWIEEAISGAAYTAMHCREIYFMKTGSLGSITMFSGDKSAQGKELEAWIERVGEVSEGAGRNRQVGRCMVYSPLVVSYTKDPKTGKVTFFDNASGEVMLSDDKDNLTFTEDVALDCGFSQGTADTEEELFKIMQLKPNSYVINTEGKKVGDSWAKTVTDSKKAASKLLTEWQIKGASQGESVQIANRIKLLDEMQRIWEKCEPVAMGYEGGGPLIPEEAQKYEDLFAGFQKAKVKAPIVKEAFQRLKKDYQQKLTEMRKKN